MGVPFETLLPYGIMFGLFGVTGFGLAGLTWFENGFKRPRWGVDKWDRQMMERDHRITGIKRGQSDQVAAPVGFEVNNRWKTEPKFL